jgi:CRP/FNR family transcriptional regulator, dissimilatory nitrate respiration regulator
MKPSISEFRQIAVVNALRSCQLFAGLPPADLENIAQLAVVKRLDKEEYLFHEGDPAQGFFVVQKGAINIHRVNAAGKEHVIHVFRSGESFAEATLATQTGYPANARAVEASQVLMVRKAEFLALFKRQPELALRMLGSLGLRLRVLVGQIEDLTLKDVETRLANWLLKRCVQLDSDQPVCLELSMTKRMLAAELGTVSETLSRTMARLRAQRLLAVKGRIITVLNPAELAALLRHNLGE